MLDTKTKFAELDWSTLPRHGTSISWTFWPGSKGETLTSIRGCKWAKYFDSAKQQWVYFETCSGCYAQNTAHSLCVRFNSPHYAGLTKATARGPIWNGKISFDEDQLLAVLQATKPRTYFLTSMGDLFYEAVSDEIVAYHVAVMIMAHWHRFLVLTKRPDRMARLWNSQPFWAMVVDKIEELLSVMSRKMRLRMGRLMAGGVPNVWLGTSIENVASAWWALSELSHVKAPGRRWTSYEPMLEYVNLSFALNHLSWVVIGGASKQGKDEAPPYDLNAAAAVMGDCAGAGVACFHKQLGANPVRQGGEAEGDELTSVRLPEHDNHNADPKHWPEWARVQQFPVPA